MINRRIAFQIVFGALIQDSFLRSIWIPEIDCLHDHGFKDEKKYYRFAEDFPDRSKPVQLLTKNISSKSMFGEVEAI